MKCTNGATVKLISGEPEAVYGFFYPAEGGEGHERSLCDKYWMCVGHETLSLGNVFRMRVMMLLFRCKTLKYFDFRCNSMNLCCKTYLVM